MPWSGGKETGRGGMRSFRFKSQTGHLSKLLHPPSLTLGQWTQHLALKAKMKQQSCMCHRRVYFKRPQKVGEKKKPNCHCNTLQMSHQQ